MTVPTLWDAKTRRIVNNESSEIIRIFNTAFSGIAQPSPDYYPEDGDGIMRYVTGKLTVTPR